MDQMAGQAVAVKSRNPLFAGLADGLQSFAASRETYLATGDPQALHRLRIALRRMRTALSILKKHAASTPLDSLADSARNIAAATGPARECDVFAARLANPTQAASSDVPARGLIAAVADRSRLCHKQARQVLAGVPAAEFAAKIEALLSDPGAGFPIRARDVMRRLYKRARKRGRQFMRLDDEGRHELRIALKKLRYAAEFFRDEFSRKRRHEKFVKRASRLQELLGAHNDLVSAAAFLESLPGGGDPAFDDERSEALEAYTRSDADASAGMARAWKKFKRAKLFWT